MPGVPQAEPANHQGQAAGLYPAPAQPAMPGPSDPPEVQPGNHQGQPVNHQGQPSGGYPAQPPGPPGPLPGLPQAQPTDLHQNQAPDLPPAPPSHLHQPQPPNLPQAQPQNMPPTAPPNLPQPQPQTLPQAALPNLPSAQPQNMPQAQAATMPSAPPNLPPPQPASLHQTQAPNLPPGPPNLNQVPQADLHQSADLPQAQPSGAESGPASPRRRRSGQPRLATQRIFSELAGLAAIAPSAYAVGEEIDGAMCLIQTADGFEVFNAAGGSRHEVRLFDDEESAYFYLFGVLAAEAVRTGRLAPQNYPDDHGMTSG
jgi:hypothetical protein